MGVTLPTAQVKLRPKAQREHEAWRETVETEAYEVGQLVTAARCITNSRDIVLHKWWEPARITEIRTFDAIVKFADGTTQSSGLGLKRFELPA